MNSCVKVGVVDICKCLVRFVLVLCVVSLVFFVFWMVMWVCLKKCIFVLVGVRLWVECSSSLILSLFFSCVMVLEIVGCFMFSICVVVENDFVFIICIKVVMVSK